MGTGAISNQLQTFRGLTAVKWRGIEIDQHLRTGRLGRRRRLRVPNVLANREPEALSVQRDHTGFSARSEVTLFIKYLVVR